jgi:hypothetical protein
MDIFEIKEFLSINNSLELGTIMLLMGDHTTAGSKKIARGRF